MEPSLTPEQIIEQINAYRVYNGLKPLKVDKKLMAAAKERAKDMAVTKSFSHQVATTTPDFKWDNFIKNAGYSKMHATENLATGYNDATSTIEAWKKSPTHHVNLVANDLEDIGVGVVPYEKNGAKSYYVVQYGGAPKKPVATSTPKVIAPKVVTTKKVPTSDGVMVVKPAATSSLPVFVRKPKN